VTTLTRTAWGLGMSPAQLERFWSNVEDQGFCWHWTGSRIKGGYGNFRFGRRTHQAHRLAYQLLVGEIGPGLQLDHLCRIRACVNPDHLEPVAQRINILRGFGASAVHARQTHCINGHEFTKANTRIRRSGRRECRTCHARQERERYWRMKADRNVS